MQLNATTALQWISKIQNELSKMDTFFNNFPQSNSKVFDPGQPYMFQNTNLYLMNINLSFFTIVDC